PTDRPRSRSPTPARASRPTSCPSSSIAFARPTRPSPAATAGSGWDPPRPRSPPPRRHGGSGLGLAIVRHLAELHEGSVQAESAGEGYGSTFTIRLPLRGGAEAGRGAPAGAPSPLRGFQLLVVDDDQDALDMLSLLLTDAGASVRTAASAAEALALLRWIRPDVLLSDLAMPDEDGYSLIRSLRTIERHSGRRTPAVALTAYVRVQDRARAVDAG